MKKTILLLLLFGLGFAFHATSQERAIVQGICTDEKGKAIENMSVYIHDSQLIAITDENGCFSYTHAKAGDQLRFVHMVYEPAFYTIKEEYLNVKPVMDLSGYPFAEMMRVHDGILYFLYPTGFNHRKALYRVRIE